jgi:predicted AlkP superfamily pyrophosphatase or phosphodiesterase
LTPIKFLPPIVLFVALATRAAAAPLLVISIDGMRPDYVTQAERHGLKIPYLRGMMTEGTYAQAVIGVQPTVTYPSHTTMVTGVAPAEHGIYNNTPFDPKGANRDGWYWYASDIRVPTLFDAVAAAHRVTASVEWPVTVGAKGIGFNIPEYRRAHTPDDLKLLRSLVRPDGYLEQLEQHLGPYTFNGNEGLADDEVRARFARQVIQERKPYFMTVHLIAVDHESHSHGPFSREANAALEGIDAMVASLASAARANDPATVVAVVSDHGFATITHFVNWRIPFAKAGLLKEDHPEAAQLDMWNAAGANSAVMLRHPEDAAVRSKVASVLERLRADPNSGVSKILEGDALEASGGWPDASFILVLRPGYAMGGAWSGPLVTPNHAGNGTHGWSPGEPDMHASFFITGAGIAKGRNLGTIDMRQLAPTFAKILDVELPTARQAPLGVQPAQIRFERPPAASRTRGAAASAHAELQ